MPFPFEFVVEGTPASLQSKSSRKRAWKAKVAHEATAKWPGSVPPTNNLVAVRITYFYDTVSPDVDNIIKPIQDALVGIVYNDDSQVTDTTSRKRNINGSFRIKGLSPEVVLLLAGGRDFLQIVISEPPAMENI